MIISFANQKGGSQKTTITQIFATIVHAFYKQFKIAVIDADLQASYYIQRFNELEEIKSNEILSNKMEHFTQNTGKNIYPVFKVDLSSGNVLGKIKELESNSYNFILIDLPGSLESDGYLDVLKQLDYIFIPFSSDQKSASSTISFLGELIRLLRDPNIKHRIKDFSLFFSKYTTNEKNRDFGRFQAYRKLFKDRKINLLDSGFHRSVKFENEQVSTIFPFPNTKENESISPYPLVGDILKFMFDKK